MIRLFLMVAKLFVLSGVLLFGFLFYHSNSTQNQTKFLMAATTTTAEP
ncbi:MAG: hypothetical protein AAGI36_07575 [Pseudomonadota bacterium]